MTEDEKQDIFSDEDALRSAGDAITKQTHRTAKADDRWHVRIPDGVADRLAQHSVGAPAFKYLLAILRMSRQQSGRNPLPFYNPPAWAPRDAVRTRALSELEEAGILEAEHRKNTAPVVLIPWQPRKG